jgi:gliding motility-associated-like protein
MKLRILYILLGFLLINFSSFSSHISGGEITYECLGGNSFRITLGLYRDCSGINVGTTASIRFANTCGLNNPANLNLNKINNPNSGQQVTEISQICQPMINLTTCNGGNLPGMQLIYYSGIVTFPAVCNSWELYHSSGARNTTVNLVGQSSYYYGATINSATAPCNNAPYFTGHQTPYVCAGQPVNYNYGVIETDGDSLVYTLISALTSSSTNTVTYVAPHSGTTPIPGIILDQSTGQLTFTPTQVGGFVVAVRITEYDPITGLVKGTVMRDIQFVVQNCPNQIVDASTISISNYTGDGNTTGQKSIEVCEGDNFCFDMVVTDPNAADIVTVTSNVTVALPGATMITSGTNPVTVSVCWNVPAGSNSLNVSTFQVRDNACPVIGQTIYSIIVRVIKSTTAGADRILCSGDSTQLEASGGAIFNWRAITGPAIAVGTNFSCNPCSIPIAYPIATTAYEVTSDLSGGCHNIDTVIVSVVPNFTYILTSSSPSSCKYEDINFDITPTPAGAYTYNWSPGIMLNNTTISNPIFSPTIAGNFTYYTAITSAQGCLKQDSIAIYVSQGIKPSVDAITDIDTIRCNEIANLKAEVDSSIAIVDFNDDFESGVINSIWTSSNNVTVRGTCGTNSGSTNALVFDGNPGDRTITTVPFQANICSTIDFCLKPASGLAGCERPDLNDDFLLEYSINAGSTWIGLRVYTTSMWSSPTTNAVFQCYSIPMPVTTGNVLFRFNQPTANYSGANYDYWILDDVNVTCSSLSNYTYTWTPATTLGSPNLPTTTATPSATTTYQIVVTDNNGGCSDTSLVEIAVKADYPDVQFSSDVWDGCYPVKVNFTNNTNPAIVGTVEWDFGNGQTSTISPSIEIDYNTPGIYDVYLKVTSPFGCESDTTINSMIHIYDYPIANFSAIPQPTNVSNTLITFENLSSLDAIIWDWNFGIIEPGYINTSNMESPSNKYPDQYGDTYEVMLAVENSDGCTDTIVKEIVIDNLYSVYVPTSFTPNGDGINDKFKPSGEQIDPDKYEFRVFNRWGNLVFFTVEIDIAWDGRDAEGNIVEQGVYTWTVRTRNANNGDKHFYKGHIMIIN